MKSMTIGVRALQAHLGETLRAVQEGTSVVVTSRGRPVAVLAKATDAIPGESALHRKLRRLAIAGTLRPAAPGAIAPFHAPRIGGLAAQILADRR